MRRFRRFYYDIFSHFYDAVIRLHSKDESAALRDFLICKTGIGPGDRMLDICTGTGSVAIFAHQAIAPDGLVVGLDFSYGMLRKAREKTGRLNMPAVTWIVADVSELPFRENTFHCVTCSHAMYELQSSIRMKALHEIRRVLKLHRRFFMMEHCKPRQPIIKFLYYVRLMSMGSPENRRFAEDEVPVLKRFLKDVKKELSPTGKSKLISGEK